MKNKKNILITIVFTFIVTLFCYLTNNYKNEVESNIPKYKDVIGTTTYHDWSEINTDTLNNGFISQDYSYSTIFYTEKTEFKIIKSAGNVTWLSNSGIAIPQITNMQEGEELILLITNCAVNKEGKILDVVIKINNIDIWESGQIYFYVKHMIQFLNSQKIPNPDGDYSIIPTAGDPISFELGATTGNCDFIMTYYESGTYNETTDSGKLGNVNYINGFYYDIDVVGSDAYSDKIFGGKEGLAPIVGKSTIYYNKNKTQPDNVDTYETHLKEIENGISIDSLTSNTNALWYGNGIFMMTEGITDSTLKLKYGGQGCGIYYIFAAPYPYKITAPIKSATSPEITRNQTITYKINQFLPNNYYGSILNFSEVFPNLHNNTRFNRLEITDTIDSDLIINGNITITTIDNIDVTNYFDITISGNTVKAVGKYEYFDQLLFYNNQYTLNIPVSLKNGTISKKAISNKATTYSKIGTNTNATTYDSNTVDLNVYYYVTVKHLAEGTNKELSAEQKIKKYNGETYTTYMLTNIPSDYEYSRKTSNYTGIITDNITVTYYYKLKKGTLTVNHLEEKTNKVLSTQEVSTLDYTTNYKTSPSTNALTTHNIVSTPENATGTINGNIIVNYYYKKKSAILTVKYLEDITNKEIIPSKSSTVYYTDLYTTTTSPEIPNNYELKRKTDNYTGTVKTKTIEVIYYYQKKDSSLETTITKTGPEEVTKKDEIVEYTITYKATTKDYIGNGTITIVDTLPYHIDLEQSNLDNGTYNEETNTITWTIPWNNIDSYNGKGETTITKNISLVYTDLLPTDRIMVNSVKGSITLDNNSREIENQTSTNISIKGKIITHHYIEGTEISIKDSVESIGLVGENYTTTSHELEGYTITKPETEVYTYKEEDQIVIYNYKKIIVHITTRVEGVGGTINGDEDIEYGSDSTEGNIVIKPTPGYIIDEVIVNGAKLDLTEDDKYGLTLDNFQALKEDRDIVVKFIKNSGVNAETGAFANFIFILIILLIVIISFLKFKKNKLIKIK